jgi:hypothetical protein
MKWPRPAIIATVLMALVVSSAAWVSLVKSFPGIAREHGPMENLQTACLLIGVILFMVAARIVRDPAGRLTLIGVSLFYFTLLLLEFDVRPFRIAALTLLLNGAIRNAIMLTLWLLLLAALFKQRAKVLPVIRSWLASSSGVLLMVSGVFWAAGRLAEELHLFALNRHNIFAEELMENQAAIIMLFAAIEALRLGSSGLGGVHNSIDRPVDAPEGSANERDTYGTHET